MNEQFIELNKDLLKDPSYVESLKREAFICSSSEQSAKAALVSMYGAIANNFFHFANTEIAESVTLQGQSAIKYTENLINNFFKDFHKNKDLLLHLGVPQDKLDTIQPIKNDVVIYVDTDSNYCTFQEIRKVLDYKGSSIELITKIYEHSLKKHLEDAFKEYESSMNGMGNYLNFELETISEVGIWIAKKKYMHNKVWEDGNILKEVNLKSTGVEIIQSSTPRFARKYLKEIVQWIMNKGNRFQLHYSEFVEYLKNIKKMFKMSNLEDICINSKINEYNKYVLQDRGSLKLAKGIPIHVRAAATYNYLNYMNKKTDKYENIKSGDRIKWYYTTNPEADVFGFLSDKNPYEFALEIDYDAQFERCILSLVNRIMKAIGMPELDSNLIYTIALF